MVELINLELFEAVVALSEKRSYEDAARLLDIPAYLLRRRIESLEERLEFHVFEPQLNEVRITSEGTIFLKVVRPSLNSPKDQAR